MRSQSSRRNGRKRSVGWFLVAASVVVACGVFFSLRSSSSREAKSEWLALNDAVTLPAIDPAPNVSSIPAVSRVFYPYSVVPGGVHSPAELRNAGARDPVVSNHYAGFDFQKARVVKVKEARLVYVSYRIRNQIYWTTKKISLHAGEDLITDGKVTARARCGNQVSALPLRKTSPEEPSVAQLDGPVDSGSSTRAPFPENFHSALESRPGPALGPLAFGPAALASGLIGSSPLGAGYLPIGSPLVPGSGCRGASCGKSQAPGGPGSGPGPGAPSVPVPEPGTLEVVFVEALGLIAACKLLVKKLCK